jgi:hypothetical protein
MAIKIKQDPAVLGTFTLKGWRWTCVRMTVLPRRRFAGGR